MKWRLCEVELRQRKRCSLCCLPMKCNWNRWCWWPQQERGVSAGSLWLTEHSRLQLHACQLIIPKGVDQFHNFFLKHRNNAIKIQSYLSLHYLQVVKLDSITILFICHIIIHIFFLLNILSLVPFSNSSSVHSYLPLGIPRLKTQMAPLLVPAHRVGVGWGKWFVM